MVWAIGGRSSRHRLLLLSFRLHRGLADRSGRDSNFAAAFDPDRHDGRGCSTADSGDRCATQLLRDHDFDFDFGFGFEQQLQQEEDSGYGCGCDFDFEATDLNFDFLLFRLFLDDAFPCFDCACCASFDRDCGCDFASCASFCN